MPYPPALQVVAGTQTLMIALATLSQQCLAGKLPDVPAGQPVWVRSAEAPGLAAAGLAAYAPAGTTLAPEPPLTVHGSPGFGRATTNTTP
jgi:hypothetical protein